MDFTNQDEDLGMPSSLGYNHPPPIRGSAFSKPSPSPSPSPSSLLSPRPGNRNVKVFGNTPPPPLHPPVDPYPSHSLGKDPDPAATPTVSPSPTAAASSGKTPATAAESDAHYRECLRNHAAAIGGHVVDGCGEFMPFGDVGTPDALKCAACGCHRSFHRKEVDGDLNAGSSPYYHGAARLPILLPPPHPQAHNHKPYAMGSSSAVVAFGGNTSGSGGTTTESSSEERMNAGAPPPVGAASRKRFRTKFSAEQKEKMLAFAESVGWRLHKQDEALVQQFCAEVGVRRQVLKVWMHNNKHTIRRQHQQQPQQEQQQQQQQQQEDQQQP